MSQSKEEIAFQNLTRHGKRCPICSKALGTRNYCPAGKKLVKAWLDTCEESGTDTDIDIAMA